MTDLRHRVERLEHAATSSTQSGATANDLANFPGMKNLVAGSGVSFTPGTGTLTITATGGGGTVTSVGMSVPSFLSVSGSPVTTSGALAVTYSGTALPIANGGSGQTTANAALNAFLPSQATHSGKVLQTDGTNTSWQTNGSGTVTSVGVSTGSSGVSVTGSPVTTSGTIDLDLGTLANVDDAPSDGTTYGRLNGAWAAAGSGSSGDPFILNVASLLHLDGSDGSTTFTDVIGNTWTASGNAQLDTAQSKFGTASLLCDGTGDYISSNSSSLNLGEYDFTVECWVRLPSIGGADYGIFINGNPSSNNNRLQASINTSGSFGAYYQASSGSGVGATGSTVLSANTWYHVAVVYHRDWLSVYLNGVLDATIDTIGLATNLASNDFYIGVARASSSPQYFNGHIDEFRITRGYARYTRNFTPPTVPFPDS